MSDVHAYLRREFKRFFPNARIHVLTTNNGETIDVGVIPPNNGNRTIRDYRMAVGSDDDYFEFTEASSGQVLTIPLMPEEVAPTHEFRVYLSYEEGKPTLWDYDGPNRARALWRDYGHNHIVVDTEAS